MISFHTTFHILTAYRKWWYGVFGAVNGGITVFSILFVKETKYIRTLAALS